MSLRLSQFVMRAVATRRWPTVAATLIILLASLTCAAVAQTITPTFTVGGDGNFGNVIGGATVDFDVNACPPQQEDGGYGNLSVYVGGYSYSMTLDGMEGDFYYVNAGGPAAPGT